MASRSRPIAVDLFAGAGGLTLGFEQAGFDVLASVELDPIHCATHEFNFPKWTIVCSSVSQISGDDIRSRSKIDDKDVDVVFGGPPCQGFSLIGKRSMDDARNDLVFQFLRLVLELRPKYFVMENVKGLTIGEHKSYLSDLIAEFRSCGYDIRLPYRVLNAANYKVPQDRRRLFLLGCRRGLELPEYPAPISKTSADLFSGRCPATTVEEAIGDLPDADKFREFETSDAAKVQYGRPSEYAKVLRGLASLPDDFSYSREFNPDFMTSSLRTEHTTESKERFAKTVFGEIESISRFFKLDPAGQCNTLRAGTASNRGAFTSPRPIHPHFPRCITVREAARIHSYPDWFRFHATKWHGFRQIGNSVPPYLGKAVAAQVALALGAESKKPQRVLELGDERLLRMNMSEAAARYGVHPHVIEPRIREVEQIATPLFESV